MWLVKFRKIPVSEHLVTVNKLNSPKIGMIALSSFYLITLVKMLLKNVYLSVFEIIGVFVNTLTVDDKYSLRNKKNLPHSVQLKLSKTKIFFVNFVLVI